MRGRDDGALGAKRKARKRSAPFPFSVLKETSGLAGRGLRQFLAGAAFEEVGGGFSG